MLDKLQWGHGSLDGVLAVQTRGPDQLVPQYMPVLLPEGRDPRAGLDLQLANWEGLEQLYPPIIPATTRTKRRRS